MTLVTGNKNNCYYCGQVEVCTKDHFFPKSKGGTFLVYACAVCQRVKANLSPKEWVTYITFSSAFTVEYKLRVMDSVRNLIELLIKNKSKVKV